MKEIQLTQGKVALVDDEDFERLNKWSWSTQKGPNTYYAFRRQVINGKSVKIWMHRFVSGITDKNILVDHRNRNGLNNQKFNLRIACKSQNSSNRRSSKNSTSVYLGVTWHKAANKWLAKIRKNGKVKHLGVFKCEIEAAKTYDKHAIEIHGEFANLNFNGL